MLKSLIHAMLNVGVTQGLTFHAVIEDGVGPVLMPNASPTAMNLNTVESAPKPQRKPSAAYSRLHYRGYWVAKSAHFSDKFNKMRL